MRVSNSTYSLENLAQTKNPRYVIRIDWLVPYYLTSHADTPLPDGVLFTHNVINSLSVTSQSLDPLNARTTIGNISFSIQDKGGFLSSLIKVKDEAGEGVNKVQVQVYSGHDSYDFDKFELIQTQILAPFSNIDNVYSFSCEDVQRSVTKNIFDTPETNLSSTLPAPFINSLTASLSISATTAVVDDTTGWPASGKFIVDQEIISYTGITTTTFTGLTRGELFTIAISHTINDVITQLSDTVSCIDSLKFEMIEHSVSYSDAPNSTVGYFKLDDEICRYYSTGIGVFTDVVRGVLNTKAVLHEFDATSEVDRNPIIKAYLYHELPFLKLAYAILTGDLYNQPGKVIESYATVNISTVFVATSKFIQHPDIWDINDDNKGLMCRFTGESKQDAMQFIQKQIYQVLGAYSPVKSDGQLSFERTTGVLSDSSYVAVLDKTNISSYGALRSSTTQIHNQIDIKWNYNEKVQNTTRTTSLIDQISINKHKATPPITKQYRGLHGSIQSTNILNNQFDSFRDRYSGPPLLITVTCLLKMNVLEVGDIVRLTLNAVKDHSNENFTTTDLDRSFEIQRVSIDWVNGLVTFQLFGSSDKAGPIASSAGASFLDDAYYTSGGTDISTVLPSTFTGGVLHIDGDGLLAGNADNTLAIYYYDGAVQFDFGTTTDVTNDNIFFRFKGHCQVDGVINLKGIGHPGASNVVANPGDFNTGIPGFFGNTLSAGTITHKTEPGVSYYQSNPGVLVEGIYNKTPSLNLINNGNSLDGIPIDLRGSSGSSGGTATDRLFKDIVYVQGGAGGNGGGSAVFVSRGIAFGINGAVNVSGNDGGLGEILDQKFFFDPFSGSGGGGANGSVYFFIDGSTSTVGTINVIANQGATPISGSVVPSNKSYVNDVGQPDGTIIYTYFTSNGNEATPHTNSSYVVQYIPANLTPQIDLPSETSKPIKISLAEVTNTPQTLSLDQASIEITVTNPADQNYASTYIEAKRNTDTVYTPLNSGNQETVAVVTMDGQTWDFRAYGVSASGLQTEDFVEKSITVSNTTGGVNMAMGNFLGINKTSFVDLAPGIFMDATALGGRIVAGGAVDSFTVDDDGSVTITGTITATGGNIGGWKITIDTIEDAAGRIVLDHANARIRVSNVAGTNYIDMDGDGIRAFDSVLGQTFNWPTDGSTPTISAGKITEVEYEITTNSILRTSPTVGDGSANSFGVQINNQGLDLFAANSSVPSVSLDAATGRMTGTGLVISGSAADENLVPNNSFDFDFDGWVAPGNTPATPVSVINDATEGNYFNMPNDAGVYVYLSKTYRLIAGKKYQIRIRAKHSSTGTLSGFSFIAYYKKIFAEPLHSGNADGQLSLIDSGVATLTASWTTYTFEYTAPFNGSWGSIGLENSFETAIDFQVAWVEVIAYGRFGDNDVDFAVGNPVFGQAGFQIEYNNNDVKVHFGDGAQRGVTYNGSGNGDLALGRDTKLLGADSINNNHTYISGVSSNLIWNETQTGSGWTNTLNSDQILTRNLTTASSVIFTQTIDRLRSRIAMTWAKNRNFKIYFATSMQAGNVVFMGTGGVGPTGDPKLEFQFTDTGVFAAWGDGTTSSFIDLGFTRSSTGDEYEIRFISGVSAEYFINGVSEHVQVANIPISTFDVLSQYTLRLFIRKDTTDNIFTERGDLVFLQEE